MVGKQSVSDSRRVYQETDFRNRVSWSTIQSEFVDDVLIVFPHVIITKCFVLRCPRWCVLDLITSCSMVLFYNEEELGLKHADNIGNCQRAVAALRGKVQIWLLSKTNLLT